jgi:hypothetical protein
MERSASTPDDRSAYEQDTAEQAVANYSERMSESSDPQWHFAADVETPRAVTIGLKPGDVRRQSGI